MCPRIARTELESYPYFHICAKGNRGHNIFVNDQDRMRYLTMIDKYRNNNNCKLLAFCLMSNHVHLLLLVPSLAVLSRVIHATHTAYATYFNGRYKLKGHLFQDRYVSWVIRNEKHLYSAKEYIENNPVQAGLVYRKEDYRWSSAYKKEGDEPFITIDSIYGYEGQAL